MIKNEVSENQKEIIHSIDTDLDVILRSIQQADDKDNKTEDLIKATDIAKFFKCHTGLTMVSNIIACPDNSVWIYSKDDEKLRELKPEGNKLKTISKFDKSNVYDMAVLRTNAIILSIEKSRLQKLNITTGKLTDTVYNVDPFVSLAVHITSGNKVVVGGRKRIFGRGDVFVMNEKGKYETVYEYDEHNQPIFNKPKSITSTSNGNIHVADRKPGRVVVLGPGGDIINTYKGQSAVNKDTPFKLVSIVTTPRGNAIVVDLDTEVFHILNNEGEYMTHCNPNDIKRTRQLFLAFTPTGKFYIGCNAATMSLVLDAKIYEVTLSGR
ncbi:unnamed protein product [Mytilus coruscus]|uniref:RING-type E3 ubiquitin transferase n=1 Tax=Mytilus coruscus TaxID=42192 RepID=A0A6J8CWX7_MYTCO|nr:unnamed protein product [Mytilus coruscus]